MCGFCSGLDLMASKQLREKGENETSCQKDHFCVNPNTCDICRKIFLNSIKATKKSDEIKHSEKKGKGAYFVPASTW